MLVGSLPAWDLERRRGHAGALVAWTLEEVRRMGWNVTALERLHEVADAKAAAAIASRLVRAASAPDGVRLFEATLRAALPELPWEHVVLRTYPRFRVLVPGDDASPLPLHTDYEGGRELDERNAWIALTRTRGTACLRAASLVDSLSYDAIVDCPTRPLEMDAGDVLLFTPLHVHGATTVLGGESRISVDVRLGQR